MKQTEIKRIASENGVPTSTIDKDWALGHILNAMYSIDIVGETLIFKGGTCLKKCYFNDYRFSEDLDFTLLDSGFQINANFINSIIEIASSNSGIKFHLNQINKQIHQDIDQGYEVEIKFWGADHNPNQRPLPPTRWQTSIKFDISFSEKLLCEPQKMALKHPYSDNNQINQSITCYSLNEIIAEKLRSLVQRNRPRDIYDNWYFSKNLDYKNYAAVKEILLKKAENKSIDISKIEYFVNEQKQKSIKRAWENSLIHQINKDKLPDFDIAYHSIKPFIEKILNS